MHITTERFTLPIPIDDALKSVGEHFHLGAVRDFSVMLAGYHNLNLKISTDRGCFVAKFFSNSSSLKRNADVITAISAFYTCGLPVPNLLRTESGATLPIFKDGTRISYVNVLEYFDGEDLSLSTPTSHDIQAIAQFIAKMHKVPLKIDQFYDDWGITNIENEYSNFAASLQADSARLVEKVVQEFVGIGSKSFHKSVIHGDLHRSNILKSKDGRYCFIDFGCVDYNCALIDIATFLAWFCFNGVTTFAEIQGIYHMVLTEYLKIAPLKAEEFEALPVYIKAAYAVFHIASSALLSRGDIRQETIRWNKKSLEGLKKSALIDALRVEDVSINSIKLFD